MLMVHTSLGNGIIFDGNTDCTGSNCVVTTGNPPILSTETKLTEYVHLVVSHKMHTLKISS